MAATNGLNTPVWVRPLCKVMKQTVCSKEQASTTATTKMSRSCTVKKSATCAEVWIESGSFEEYFKALDKVLKAAAAAAKLAAQAAAEAQPSTSATPAAANATALRQAFQAAGGRRLLQQDSSHTRTAVVAKEAEEALRENKSIAFVKSKCKAIGGTVRTMSEHGRAYCSVGCNPSDRVVREMLALQGSKWTTDWRSGNWCEPAGAAL